MLPDCIVGVTAVDVRVQQVSPWTFPGFQSIATHCEMLRQTALHSSMVPTWWGLPSGPWTSGRIGQHTEFTAPSNVKCHAIGNNTLPGEHSVSAPIFDNVWTIPLQWSHDSPHVWVRLTVDQLNKAFSHTLSRQIYYVPAPTVGGIKRWCASHVCLTSGVSLSVAYIGPK